MKESSAGASVWSSLKPILIGYLLGPGGAGGFACQKPSRSKNWQAEPPAPPRRESHGIDFATQLLELGAQCFHLRLAQAEIALGRLTLD